MLVDDQRVRLTLDINDTKFVRDNIDEIKKYDCLIYLLCVLLLTNRWIQWFLFYVHRALDDATGLEFNVDSIQYHLQSNGKYDLSK